MKNLYELEDNLIGTVVKLDNQYQSKLRLAEMGVMPGVDIRMVKKSPLSGPVQIKINNYYLTLRKEDAILIHVESLQS
jgi:Fe2+ transport system protein FeoA